MIILYYMDAQLAYFYAALSQLDIIVPPEKQHLYHLIFGSKILASFTTLEDMLHAADHKFKGLICLRYSPLTHNLIKIQSLWRGALVRRKMSTPR